MTPSAAITHCRRCGTCCRQGGPALHLEDRELVESGKIPMQHLFTIRQGEPAYDNVTGTIAPAVTDIIKLKGARPGSDVCCFYESAGKVCGIYGHRPAPCNAGIPRALKRCTGAAAWSGVTCLPRLRGSGNSSRSTSNGATMVMSPIWRPC
jgi:Fe-S-cluster containining protein